MKNGEELAKKLWTFIGDCPGGQEEILRCMWAGPPSDLVEIRSLCDKILFVGQNVKMYHYIQLC